MLILLPILSLWLAEPAPAPPPPVITTITNTATIPKSAYRKLPPRHVRQEQLRKAKAEREADLETARLLLRQEVSRLELERQKALLNSKTPKEAPKP